MQCINTSRFVSIVGDWPIILVFLAFVLEFASNQLLFQATIVSNKSLSKISFDGQYSAYTIGYMFLQINC